MIIIHNCNEPIVIHMKNRNHVIEDRCIIRATLKRILNAGNRGTIGVRNFPLGGFCLWAQITKRPANKQDTFEYNIPSITSKSKKKMRWILTCDGQRKIARCKKVITFRERDRCFECYQHKGTKKSAGCRIDKQTSDYDMSSIIILQPVLHPGVSRFESAWSSAQQLRDTNDIYYYILINCLKNVNEYINKLF